MRILLPVTSFILHRAVLVMGTAPAALLGAGYPPPTDLTSNSSLVSAAWSNLTSTINSYIRKNQTLEGLLPDLDAYTFSIGTFSVHDPTAAQTLQYHHTGPDVANSTTGVTKVNGDSVYRIASISKAFTVYLTLLEIGSGYWERPITDFVSDLAVFADHTRIDPLRVVDWKSVTLGTLAGHMAGIPHEAAPFNEDLLLSLLGEGTDPWTVGLPPVNISDPAVVPPCVYSATATSLICPENQYVQGISARAPVLLAWTSPIYSDAGFTLLSLAVENITGKSFHDMFHEDMFGPLEMASTSYNVPTNYTNAVVPGGNPSVNFAINGGITSPSGGISSTLNDLAKFGTSILNSTLLRPEETRKWMKPITHTGSLQLSIGRPWEIFRIIQPSTRRTNDLYTKEGDGLDFASYLILSPDHEAGFSILVAGTASRVSIANTVIADILTSTVIAALESEAAAEAAHKFAGKYVSNVSGLNSSITLAVDPSYGSGLIVQSWISNSTDIFSFLDLIAGDELSLAPTNLRSAPTGHSAQVSFRGIFGSSTYTRKVGPFTDQITTDVVWEDVDVTEYGGVSLDLFIFTVDANGHAVAVSPAATRATLLRAK